MTSIEMHDPKRETARRARRGGGERKKEETAGSCRSAKIPAPRFDLREGGKKKEKKKKWALSNLPSNPSKRGEASTGPDHRSPEKKRKEKSIECFHPRLCKSLKGGLHQCRSEKGGQGTKKKKSPFLWSRPRLKKTKGLPPKTTPVEKGKKKKEEKKKPLVPLLRDRGTNPAPVAATEKRKKGEKKAASFTPLRAKKKKPTSRKKRKKKKKPSCPWGSVSKTEERRLLRSSSSGGRKESGRGRRNQ